MFKIEFLIDNITKGILYFIYIFVKSDHMTDGSGINHREMVILCQ
jgi:hypothetical protein